MKDILLVLRQSLSRTSCWMPNFSLIFVRDTSKTVVVALLRIRPRVSPRS